MGGGERGWLLSLTAALYSFAVQEPYYKKSDGGGRLGYWNTTEAAIEADIAELEALVQMARSARAASPAAVSVADDALAAASWALKAFRLFMCGGGGGAAGVWKASGGGEGAGRGRKGLPAFSELSALLETAVRAQRKILLRSVQLVDLLGGVS